MTRTVSNHLSRLARRTRMGTLGKNTVYVGIGQATNLALAFVLTPVAARVLGDSDFGRYSLASTLMFFVFLLSDLGMNTWITREAARKGEEAVLLFRSALGLKLVLSPVVLAILWMGLRSLRVDPSSSRAIAIFAVYGVLSSVWQLAVAVFRARELMKYETVLFSFEKAAITVGALSVFALGGGLIEFVAVFPVAGAITVVAAFLILRRRFFSLAISFNLGRWARMVRTSFAYGLSTFLATVYNKIDVIILSAMTTPAVVGWYSAAYKLLTVTNLIPTVVATAAFPRFAALHDKDWRELSRVFSDGVRLLFAISVPMVLAGAMLARPITALFFGDQYAPTAPAMQILIWACAIIFFNIYLAGFLGALGYQTRVVRVQIVGTILNVLANVLLIPRWQHLGASFATVLTEGVICLYLFRFSVPRLVRFEGLRIWTPLVVSNAALFVVLTFLISLRWNVVSILVIAGVTYVSIFSLTGGKRALALFTT